MLMSLGFAEATYRAESGSVVRGDDLLGCCDDLLECRNPADNSRSSCLGRSQSLCHCRGEFLCFNDDALGHRCREEHHEGCEEIEELHLVSGEWSRLGVSDALRGLIGD